MQIGGGVPFGIRKLADGRIFSRAKAKVEYGFPNGSRPRVIHKLAHDRVQIWWFGSVYNRPSGRQRWSHVGLITAMFRCSEKCEDVALLESVQRCDDETSSVELCHGCFYPEEEA